MLLDTPEHLFPVLSVEKLRIASENISVIFVRVVVMSNVLVALCRNRCTSFKQFRNFPIRRVPLTSVALFSRHPRLASVSCLPMLHCKLSLCSDRNHFCECSTLLRWQTSADSNTAVGRVRAISFSKMRYTHDDRDEGGTTVGSSAVNDDDTVSSDSAEDNAKVSHLEAASTCKAEPVSEVDVEKELLRYDYEEFELMPDEQVSIVQPVKKSFPVELKSKSDFFVTVQFAHCVMKEWHPNIDCCIFAKAFQFYQKFYTYTHTHTRLTALCPGLPG